jgi:hypothetical protein
MHRDLHDLCQPLTALQCRLEVAQLVGDRASLREAVDGGLEETQRIFAVVARMRSCLRAQDDEAIAMSAVDCSSMIV